TKPYYTPEGVAAPAGAATLTPSLPMPVSLEIDQLREQFAYDQRSALHYSEESTADVGGVSVRDISYDSPRGGRTEAILAVPAGVEHRISAFLLKSGGSLAFLERDYPRSKGAKAEYLALMASVDQIRYISFAAPSVVFLQNGIQDGFFGLDDMRRWHATASDPKITKLYEAGHELDAQATADGVAWLMERLSLQRR